jgi:hypothetical protein
MADIAVQDVVAGGLADLAFTNAAASQTVPANSGTKSMGGYDLHAVVAVVRNGDAASHDVTIGSQAAVTVAAGKTAVIPVPNTGINGPNQAITWSATTSMSIALARIGSGY